MKGGYQIIDLRETNFTAATAVTIPGVYEQIEGNYNKPLLLEGFSIGDIEYNATWVNKTVDSTNFKLSGVSGYDVTVTPDDKVTFTVITSGGDTE